MDMGKSLHDLAVEFRGWSRKGTVLGDVGAEHVLHAGFHIFSKERQQLFLRVFLPPVDAHEAVTHIGSKDHLLSAIGLEPSEERLRLTHGNAPHGHHGGSRSKRFLDILLTLDATTEVDRQARGLCDTAQHRIVDDVLGLGTIEINDMQTLETQALKLTRLRHGILVVDLLLTVVAFGQPHTFAADDIYGWDQFYVHSSRKFRRICSPTLPLFSGWNCTVQKLSRCMAAE